LPRGHFQEPIYLFPDDHILVRSSKNEFTIRPVRYLR